MIGVTHAGYKGLVNHVLENTVERFISEFSSDPKDIIVGIGPSIEKACYEVSKERVEEFESAFPDFTNMYEALDGKFYLDLRSVARQCLLKEGILEGNIESMDICTKCNFDFYSYRRGDKYERFVSVISLV